MNKIIYKSKYTNEYNNYSYFIVGATEDIEEMWNQLNNTDGIEKEFTDDALFSIKRKVYAIQLKATTDDITKALISIISAENIMVLLLNDKIIKMSNVELNDVVDMINCKRLDF